MLSGDGLARIAAGASTLAERVAGEVQLEPGSAFTTDRRIARWAEQTARSDPDRFATRLDMDGLDAERARLVVGRARPRAGAPLPDWAVYLAEALADAARAARDPADRALLPEDPIPLEELSLPFLRAARARLERLAPADRADVAAPVVIGEERALLVRLGIVLSPVLDLELAIERDRRLGRLREAALRAEGWGGRELYLDLVARLLEGDLAPLLEGRPALARLLARAALAWVDAIGDFRRRLAADRPLVAQRLGGGVPPGALVANDGLRSDPHRGGRTVVGCRFASGLRVVYKPKSLRSEIVLSDLLRWLNDRGLSTPLRPLTVLDRGDYGWVEHCAQAPAGDAGAVARHYRRAGALLALMRAVGGTDAHMENLVAAGEHPQIVDAETVLRPRLVDVEVAAAGAPSAFDEAARRIDESVLAVGLLPSWSVSEDGLQAIDVSGLGARGPQRSWRERRTWEAPNTDLARRVMELAPVPEAANEVVLDGVTQRCEEHAEAIEAGFVEAYGLLRAGRAELGGPAGPLAGLAGAPVRVIFRNTQLYALALGSAASSEHMRDGVDRSIALEALARPLLDRRDARGHWPLLRSELAELEAGDIPYFAVPGGDDWLAVDGGGVPLAESALEGARRRLAALDDQDLARQVSYVRAALEARGDGPEAARPVPRRGSAEPIDGARAIGRILDERAIRGDRGGLAWIGPSLVHASGRVQLRPSGFDLYGGVVGVAVFLAALARAGGDPRPARLAAAALAPVLEAVDGGADRIPPAIGLGGSAGAGGLVHGLVAVHRLSGDGAPLDAATAIARAVRDDAIDADERLDLMGGAAGLCLGFLALHRETGDQVVLAKARRAGERLLARQRPEPEGGAAWPTWSGAALCFPSHGASGMALALARLADRAEDPRFGDAAARAFDFEDACFDPGRGGWPDRRDSARTGPPSAQWCHGAAGVGLTRLGLRGTAVGAARAGADDVALAAAIAAAGRDFPERDNLCCGAAGVAEFVRAAGDPAAGSPVAAAASAWAGDVAARVIAGDPVRLFARAVGGLPAPGLYLGLAGIGMALLGRRDPELPGVLLWN